MGNELIETAGAAAGALDSKQARLALVPLMPGGSEDARSLAYEQFVTQMAEAAGKASKPLSFGSLVTAASQAARTQLVPDGMGSAYLVAYGSEVVFTVGPRGWQTLIARLSTKQCFARCVHEGDEFTMPQEFPPKPMHHQPSDARDRSSKPITHAYAVAEMPDGTWATEILDATELDKARQASPAGVKGKGPWVTWPERMSQAKAWRRLGLRLVAISADPEAKSAMHAAIEAEDAEFTTDEPTERIAPARDRIDAALDAMVDAALPPPEAQPEVHEGAKGDAWEPGDAKPVECGDCDGTGESPQGGTCKSCDGKGRA